LTPPFEAESVAEVEVFDFLEALTFAGEDEVESCCLRFEGLEAELP